MFNDALERIWEEKVEFLSAFFLVFTVSYLALLALDYLPEPPSEESEEVTEPAELKTSSDSAILDSSGYTEESYVSPQEVAVEASEPAEVKPVIPASHENQSQTSVAGDVLPLQIYIEKLDKTLTVLNPTSRAIADLDAALLDGVVRHPDSATLEQEGNVFILGHSSYLPTVFNKNFQAFNGIQNLEWGDMITVSSDGTEYKYRVEKVYRANAQDVTVPIAGEGNKLTLATCNSFGSVDDRYIVEAKRIN